MTTVIIKPTPLKGCVSIPSSKSMTHREIICAALAEGKHIVDNISMSEDINATLRCLNALNISHSYVQSNISGRTAVALNNSKGIQIKKSMVNCGESGSTLRFMVPLAASCDGEITFCGEGNLVKRPMDVYYQLFDEQGLSYSLTSKDFLPLMISGKLKSGKYKIPGNVSSQFISGLLLALPLLEGDSQLEITSKLESKSYVDLTLACLSKFGISVEQEENKFEIKGSQNYNYSDKIFVEGDWSQAAFWLVAGTIGEKITCKGISPSSLQGDKAVVEIIKRMGGKIAIGKDSFCASPSKTTATIIDGSNCPDIIPILTVLASVSNGVTKIINAGRLRIKECDRLQAISSELNKLGAKIVELQDGLIIEGCPEGLIGGSVSGCNDHRIAMSLAVASIVCREAVILEGSECVNKSYPQFWEDFQVLGGNLIFKKTGE